MEKMMTEQELQDYWDQRAKATTLTELREDRTSRIFVAFPTRATDPGEPHIEQPLREQEAYDDVATSVIVVHPDGSRTYYASMPWMQVQRFAGPSDN
jgi:hypothetical protein